MFRQAREEQTAVGLAAADFMDRGLLVPDHVVVALVAERLRRGDCADGCLFDGFPRTVAQAQALDQTLQAAGTPVNTVLALDVDTDELTRRLLARGRSDDELATIRRRLDEYQAQTAPLLEYYRGRGLLHMIDGRGSVEDVFRRIAAAVGGLPS
jgi:adenylate kinase